MFEQEILFLTIPFLALLVGFVFTYIHVWHNKSKREASESQITENIVAQLREHKTEDIQKNAEKEKTPDPDELVKELLAQQYLVAEKRWEEFCEANKIVSDKISKLEAKMHSNQRSKVNPRSVGLAMSNSLGVQSYIGETKAAMQALSLQMPSEIPYDFAIEYRASLPSRFRGRVKTRDLQVKGASSKTK
ncbi:hypothetical protein [Vibrio sp. FJH11]